MAALLPKVIICHPTGSGGQEEECGNDERGTGVEEVEFAQRDRAVRRDLYCEVLEIVV
jgi:hypothetical protein